MFALVILLVIAVAIAVATVLWARHDHALTHPRPPRSGTRAEWIVDRWEQLTARAARALVEQMRALDRRGRFSR